MCSGHQHAEQKDASYRAETNAANRVDDLQYGTELLDDNATNDAIDAGEEDEQLHNAICLVLGVIDVWLDVVKVDDAAQRVHVGRERAEGSAKDARDEDSWHATKMTHDILHEIGYHLVQLVHLTRAERITIVIAGIHYDARKAIEGHDEDETESEEHQRSEGGSLIQI